MVILFDGVCNFCNSSVNLIIKLDKNKIFKFAALQSKFGQNFLALNNLETSNFDTIVLIENNVAYFKSEAFFKIIKQLQFPLNLLGVFKVLPVKFLNRLYDLIAKSRYSIFGKKDSCVIPSKDIRDRFLD